MASAVGEDAALQRAEALIPADTVTALSSKKWKERLTGMESLATLAGDLISNGG